MACGSGCTDCPTCRGEVLPDSPVMHDMDFGMAMNRDPMTWDPVMSPHAVAQTVRDGIMARGATGAGDAQILNFVRDTHAAVSAAAAAAATPLIGLFDDHPVQPPPGPSTPTTPVLPSTPLTGDPDGDPVPAQAPTILTAEQLKQLKRVEPTKTVETTRKQTTEKHVTVESVADITERVRKKHGAKAEPYCDVEYFRFPASFYKTWDKKNEVLGVTFTVKAKYKQAGASSTASAAGADGAGQGGKGDDGKGEAVKIMVPDCGCCEYKQFVNAGKDGAYVQECYLIDRATGGVRRTSDVDRDGNPPEPTPTEMMICPGDQVANEKFKSNLRDAGIEPNLETDSCLLNAVDVSGSKGRFGTPGFHELDFKYLGLIEDRCVPPAIRAIESFSLKFSVKKADMHPTKPWSDPSSTLPRDPLTGLSGGNTDGNKPTESLPYER